MTSANTKLRLGTAPVAQAEAMKRKLATHGIEVALIHNEVTCTTGCSLTVEVWAHPDDVPEIGRLSAEARHEELTAMGYDPALADSVFDPSAGEATCPACSTTFATTASECPECGLCFGVPEEKGGCGSSGCC